MFFFYLFYKFISISLNKKYFKVFLVFGKHQFITHMECMSNMSNMYMLPTLLTLPAMPMRSHITYMPQCYTLYINFVFIYLFFYKVYMRSIRYKYTFVSLPMTCQKNILSAIQHRHHRIFHFIYNS